MRELRDQLRGDVVDGEVARRLGDAGVEQDLQQQVSEFLADLGRVADCDGVEQFVGLLHEVRGQGLVRLSDLPAAVGPQPVHDLGSFDEPISECPIPRRWIAGGHAGAPTGTDTSTAPAALPSIASRKSAMYCN